jgi:regulator of sirC expression with transglutaminase-like and TPR domain
MTYPPLHHRHLYQELQQPADQVNLARAALYLAQEEYPDLSVPFYLSQLDTLARNLGRRLPSDRYPLRLIRGINDYLFDHLGFAGNDGDYYDPRNSFLNEVLRRRLGIPLTLSLVYLELAQRVGLAMAGVGLPGHFLIRPTGQDLGVFVDPFHQGEILFEQDCQALLHQLFGAKAPLDPRHLEPVRPIAWILRMLSNLKMIYLNQHQRSKALAAIDRILLIQPTAVSEWRDRGLIYYQDGDLESARLNLERYLYQYPEASDGLEIRQVITQIEQQRGER